MSGIVGVFNLNGEPVRRETLISMCYAINHRGPHGRGVWTEGPVGFGHVLLHTTEESINEEQPFTLDGQTWITADTRIDDRASLIELLKSHVASYENLHEATDVTLLLHAYHVWGVDCVHHVTGVFGAAIWDGHKQKLICLRDHIGIKPFYYAYTQTRMVFASEVKGILASGLVPQRIYEPRIADFLVQQLEGIDKTCTFFENVVRLPPAHRMVVSRYRTDIDEYWELDPTKEIRFKDQRDYIEAFREQFYKAVNCRLRGAKPVASMLSGGLDSSSIVAVARDVLSKEYRPSLPTFSMMNSKDPDCLETFYINAVLATGGLDYNNVEVKLTPKYIENLNKILHSTDDLFDLTMAVPPIMYIEANRHGISAMLDGIDGDLVMGQPGNHIAYLLQCHQWKAALCEAKSTRKFYCRFPNNTYSYLYGAFRSAFTPNLLRSLRQRWRELRNKHTLKQEMKDTIINHDFAARIDLPGRIAKLQSHRMNSDQINLRLNHANALNHPYLVVALERYDRVASRYSIEPRHPILDRRLIEFCLALPWEQKIQDGWTKMITRLSMIGLLPEKVVWRRGFEHLGSDVIAHLMSKEINSTKENVIDKIDSVSQYVDVDTVKRAFHSYTHPTKLPSQAEGWKVMEVRLLLQWKARWE